MATSLSAVHSHPAFLVPITAYDLSALWISHCIALLYDLSNVYLFIAMEE